MQISLANFTYPLPYSDRLLHNHLMSILTTNNFEHEHLPQKIMQYIGMIVQSQKNQNLRDDFFDYFCENGGNKIIKLTLEVEPMLSVRVLAMLFINLTSQQWISYLLCQSFVVSAIQFDQTPTDQEWPEYYISLLKSLSIRFNEQQLSLFFNKKFSKFPLIYESLKYYNHPDCMVRTNVMNIILGIMKIRDKKLAAYFGRFPFTSYVITYCCQVMTRIRDLDLHLLKIGDFKDGFGDKQERNQHYGKVKSYYIDIIDYICFLNDLMELGSAELSYFVMNCVLTYIALPSLKNLLQQKNLLSNSSLFLLLTLYKTITNQNFKQTLTLLLLSRSLPTFLIEKLNNIKPLTAYIASSSKNKFVAKDECQEVYIPKVYTEQFNPNKYYWNQYEYQIEKQCMQLFQDVTNFQTEHQSKEENLDKKKEFQEEIAKISKCLGFDILRYQPIQNRAALIQLPTILGFQPNTSYNYLSIPPKLSQHQLSLHPNPIRSSLFSQFETSVKDFPSDSLLLCLCTLFNSLSKCETTDNKILQFCGILLPRLDTVNFKQEFNVKSMQKIKDIWVMFLQVINQSTRDKRNRHEEEKQKETLGKVDQGFFGVQTIRNFMVLGFQCFYQRLSENQQAILLQFYKNSTEQFKQLIVKKNMKFIVQNFESLYVKWIKQSLFFNPSLTQSVLSPRKSAKQLSSQQQDEQAQQSRLYFHDQKQKVLYFIKKFILSQTFTHKYHEHYASKQPNPPCLYLQKYSTLSHEKYTKIDEMLKIGHSYQLGYKNMVECYSQEKKAKNAKKYIIVENNHNFILVEPSLEENSAKIIVNHPWKYVTVEVDRETGRKMLVKLKNGKVENRMSIYFEDQARNVGTLDWMNGLKFQRYQSEQAFILSYVKDCLRN